MTQDPKHTRRPRTLRSILERAVSEGFASVVGSRPRAGQGTAPGTPETRNESTDPAWLARRRAGESLP